MKAAGVFAMACDLDKTPTYLGAIEILNLFFVIEALIFLDLMHYLHASGVRGSQWSLREVRVARVRSRIQRSVEEGSGVENSACLAG